MSLAKARGRAREAKEMVWQGIDPIEKKRSDRDALIKQQKRAMSFAQAVERFLKDKAPTQGNANPHKIIAACQARGISYRLETVAARLRCERCGRKAWRLGQGLGAG